ncbi:MAG: ABC transporter permease [Pyrinomonadaceae bacterium]
MKTLWQDIRYGLRLLWKSPGFTIIAVLSLSLGIGANATIFAWVKTVLLRPLPGVEASDQLVAFHGVLTRSENRPISTSYPDYKDYRDRNEVFSGLFAYGLNPFNLSGGDSQPERIWGETVSGNYFDVLGVKPVKGRGFLPEEDATPGSHPVVVLSYRLWQRRYGGDPDLVGKTITLNNKNFTVVGIAPQQFAGTYVGLATELYVPLAMIGEVKPDGGSLLTRRGNQWLQVIGRLKPNVTFAQAQANTQSIARALAQEYPRTNDGHDVALFTLARDTDGAQVILLPVLTILMVVAGLVLLIACANVANLLLARAAARRREIGIRLALGASRGRIVRQLLTESVLLALLGGIAGLFIALWTAGSLGSFVPPIGLPVSLQVNLDARVLGFTFLVSLATGVLFGLAPALASSRPDLVSTLKDESGSVAGGRGKGRFRNSLVVAQIALSLVSLIGAGLFVRSLQRAQTISPGFDPDNVLLASFDLFPNGYDEARGTQFYRALTERVGNLPGVESVSLADSIPLGLLGNSSQGVSIEGYTPRRDEELNFAYNTIAPGFLRTMRIPLASGREFEATDGEKSQGVVIINETAARRYFAPGQDADGKRLKDSNGHDLLIVGVAKDIKYKTLNEPPKPYMYLPLFQNYTPDMTLVVRTKSNPLSVLSGVRNEVHALDANVALFNEKTLVEHAGVSLFAQRLAVTFLSVFGLLALALAAIGIYGVMAYSVAQRTHEIGVRMALGAQTSDVLKLITRQGFALAITGIGIGLLSALALTHLLTSLLYGVSAIDPLTFIVMPLLLGGVALLACYVPARRATKVDPMIALRHE